MPILFLSRQRLLDSFHTRSSPFRNVDIDFFPLTKILLSINQIAFKLMCAVFMRNEMEIRKISRVGGVVIV